MIILIIVEFLMECFILFNAEPKCSSNVYIFILFTICTAINVKMDKSDNVSVYRTASIDLTQAKPGIIRLRCFDQKKLAARGLSY